MTSLHRVPRRLIQLTCFVGALVLVWPVLPWAMAPRYFQQISPFVALSSSIAKRSIDAGAVLALVVAVFSSFKKRWFCLYLCPTGFLLESTSRVGLRRTRWWSKLPPVGRYVAILTLAGSIVGYPVLMWMDPLCIFSSPFAANKATNPLSVLLVSLGLGVLVGATFVFGMAWCVRICPLSGFQDMLFAMRKALWTRLASTAPGQKFIKSFSAGRSVSADVKLVKIAGASVSEGSRARPRESGMARRAFFAGAGGALLALGARRLGAARFRKSDTLLRPPGAVPEDRFAGLCIRCNNCVHACPSKIIEPDNGREAGLAGFGAPIIRFNRDYKYCLETCNECTQVCPTGALTPLPLEQKNKYIIGEALPDNNVCLTALGQKECNACEHACPYDAVKITWDEAQYIAYPVVNDKCVGCGACEVVCPTTPVKAIRVWTQKPA
ncbi:MAG TPA: 4Fe-4S dicluster domain-containing protein [Candidatus Acidoferrales bacterium]|jgi:ferredoxin-type protein NapF|nr:4Fe-4S dicluster domain-containing protein [Candidatus Acidoferrales bacterium]